MINEYQQWRLLWCYNNIGNTYIYSYKNECDAYQAIETPYRHGISWAKQIDINVNILG